MDKIYIVTSGNGDCESHTTQNLKAFIEEKDANEFKALAESFTLRLKQSEEAKNKALEPSNNQFHRREISMQEYQKLAMEIVRPWMEEERKTREEAQEALGFEIGPSGYWICSDDSFDVEEIELK